MLFEMKNKDSEDVRRKELQKLLEHFGGFHRRCRRSNEAGLSILVE